MISGNWSHEKNQAGVAGNTTQEGVAGHGTSSPYDIHATLIAVGPDFREHAVSTAPTANVDIAPTLLTLLGLPIPASMTGRPFDEALRSGPALTSLRVAKTIETAKTADGSYQVDAHLSTVAGKRYLDYTEVHRAPR